MPFDGPLRVRIDGVEHYVGTELAASVHVVRPDGPNRPTEVTQNG